jgi:hypothetical protein
MVWCGGAEPHFDNVAKGNPLELAFNHRPSPQINFHGIMPDSNPTFEWIKFKVMH